MTSLVDTYERHVITTTFLQNVPDFRLLFNIIENRWPSLKEANEYFSEELNAIDEKERTKHLAYCNFVNGLLMDTETYGIAKKFWEISVLVEEKNASAIEKLYDLKVSLMDLPSIIPLIPLALQNILRAVKKPSIRSNWGLLFLTKHHNISCAFCQNKITKQFIRLRCQCSPFGVLTHASCFQNRRCCICSTKYMVTKVEHQQSHSFNRKIKNKCK